MILHEYKKNYLQPRIFFVPNKKKKAITSKHAYHEICHSHVPSDMMIVLILDEINPVDT